MERLLNEYPLLSLRERDRRWREIRRGMAARGLNGLLVCGNNRNWGSGLGSFRFVSHVGGKEGVVVFPFEGNPVVFATMEHYYRPYNYLSKVQNWVGDVRPLSGTKGIAEAMHSLGLSHGRIGYVERASLRTYTMPYTFFTALRNLLPQAEFVDAGDLLDQVRMIKSEDEIGFLKRSGKIAKAMVDAKIKSAKPGVTEAHVYAEMLRTQLMRGGEDYGMIQLTSDDIKRPNRCEAMKSWEHPRIRLELCDWSFESRLEVESPS